MNTAAKTSHLPTVAMVLCVIAANATAQTTTLTTAQTKPADDVQSLEFTAAPLPVPALRYDFRPRFASQMEGNAAPAYLNAFAALPAEKDLGLLTDAYLEATTDDEFLKRTAPAVGFLRTTLPSMIEIATRYDRCNWTVPYRDKGINTLLPYLNHCREETNWLLACARFAMIQQDTDRALLFIGAVSTLANRTSDGAPFMVSNLVGVGMQAQCHLSILALLQRPKSPNLYWALRHLPSPSASIAAIMQSERDVLEISFPELRNASSKTGEKTLTPEQWKSVLTSIIAYQTYIASMDTGSPSPAIPSPDLTSAQMEASYRSFRELVDESTANLSLPYPESLPAARRFSENVAALRTRDSMKLNPFLLFLSDCSRFLLTNARLDRTQAALTTVEALRAYAATHANTLPASLADLVDTPAPNNPITGLPFEYTRTSPTTATLGDTNPLARQALRYEITLRK